MHEFREWPKTKRLFRDIVVTEKLDGTNSAIHISAAGDVMPEGATSVHVDGRWYVLSAQSRKRIITPGKTTDNYGFAAWVYNNAEQLVRLLGEGLHFGEWWGAGIQRGYGLAEAPVKRRFSLFNTQRFGESFSALIGMVGVEAVPVLYTGPFEESAITRTLSYLQETGSDAAPGFMDPEGVCIFHTQSRNVYKVTLDHNDAGKWEVAA